LTGLPAVAAGSDSKVRVLLGNAHLLEENLGHFMVVMLPGMDEVFVYAGITQGKTYGSSFDELGTGSNDSDDFHGIAATLDIAGRSV